MIEEAYLAGNKKAPRSSDHYRVFIRISNSVANCEIFCLQKEPTLSKNGFPTTQYGSVQITWQLHEIFEWKAKTCPPQQ